MSTTLNVLIPLYTELKKFSCVASSYHSTRLLETLMYVVSRASSVIEDSPLSDSSSVELAHHIEYDYDPSV